ncbi:MAG: class I SAM-dependent methyltransferase [Candidatus Pacearchaeota archaeon]
MTKEKVEEFYDILSEHYEIDHSTRFVDNVFEHFLYRYLPKQKNIKILDAGGGIGRFSFPLAKKGHLITLTDISIGMLNKAKKIASNCELETVKFFKESVTDMKNQEDNSFDLVLMMNGVLDYCRDHKKALKEVYRVLKKSGILIGTVNNRFIYATINVLLEEKKIEEFKKTFETGNMFKKFPIHNFTSEELKEELINAGFEIIDILGPTNLLRKWEYESIVNKDNEEKLLSLQIEFAKKKEYLNNSTDFLFIAKKL